MDTKRRGSNETACPIQWTCLFYLFHKWSIPVSIHIHSYPFISIHIHSYPFISIHIHSYEFRIQSVHSVSWSCDSSKFRPEERNTTKSQSCNGKGDCFTPHILKKIHWLTPYLQQTLHSSESSNFHEFGILELTWWASWWQRSNMSGVALSSWLVGTLTTDFRHNMTVVPWYDVSTILRLAQIWAHLIWMQIYRKLPSSSCTQIF